LKISFLHHKYILKVSLTSLLEIEISVKYKTYNIAVPSKNGHNIADSIIISDEKVGESEENNEGKDDINDESDESEYDDQENEEDQDC